MSWVDRIDHTPTPPMDWGGIALGALFALCLLIVLVLAHFLERNDRNGYR